MRTIINAFRALPYSLGKLLSNIFTSRVTGIFKKSGNAVYSGWLSNSIGKCHEKLNIEYPAVIIGGKYMTIGKNFSSRGRLRMEAYDQYMDQTFSPRLVIGNNVCINFDCHIGCINSIEIHDNVLIGSKVLITDHFHGESNEQNIVIPPSQRTLFSKGTVVIEQNVWIGEGVAIMSNVTIGENSIIGANAVVTTNIPPNSIAVGIPAKVIRTLEPSEKQN